MLTHTVSIRAAKAQDALALVELCRQLGHAIRQGAVQRHLRQPAGAGHRLLVAVLAGRVVGWLEVEARASLPTGRWAEVTGLVVEETVRRRGVGRALVRSARKWARSRGLGRLRVRTRLERTEAARFYEQEGFALNKQQRVYDAAL